MITSAVTLSWILRVELRAMSDNFLSTEELETVLDSTIDAKSKWYKVGLGLGVRLPRLDAIKAENSNDLDACYTEMLKEWLNNPRGAGPTWSDIVRSLRSNYVRLGSLANEVSEKFCPHLQHVDCKY